MSAPYYIVQAKSGLESILAYLKARQYRLIGPVRRDDAIVFDDIVSFEDLPVGWTERQDGGQYRLERRGDDAVFGYSNGPQSLKAFFHVPYRELWRVERRNGDLTVSPAQTQAPRYAFIGVRSCDIHAVAVQDRVLMQDRFSDDHYESRRAENFILAVNCGQAGGTCFCDSMHTGPKADHGFDLALTELMDATRHDFLVECGSEKGRALMQAIPSHPARPEDIECAEAVIASTISQMGRHMDADSVHDLLLGNLGHSRWDEVAQRCLSCGNCTLVCPTCFCTRESETSDLSGDQAVHSRAWDSCFTLDFSYVHGGSVRHSVKSRYRQWLTHKLATWIDQFGTSGCVGCGRCITWCPVAIDLTEEVAAIAKEKGHA